jgi:hypothetical protein
MGEMGLMGYGLNGVVGRQVDVVDGCLQCYRLLIFIYILFANILLYGIK